MNKKLGRYLNFYDIHDLTHEINPDLAVAENFYDRLREFYHKVKKEYKNAKTVLNSLIKDLRSSGIPEFDKLCQDPERVEGIQSSTHS